MYYCIQNYETIYLLCELALVIIIKAINRIQVTIMYVDHDNYYIVHYSYKGRYDSKIIWRVSRGVRMEQ